MELNIGPSDAFLKDAPFKGRKNIYLCDDCGHGFVSQDVDDGTTPLLTTCRHPGCGNRARSLLYSCPQDWLSDVRPVVEWYMPAADEFACLTPAMQEHVRRGGLLARDRAQGGAA